MTEEILKKSGSSCGAKVNEVLISCIARAIGSMTGQKKIAVNLEGHGREQIHETIDIDRTVGWFTTIYPVILDCTQDIRLSLIDAKETVRSVPNGGLGYGCHLFSQEKNQSDISFNYLGELDEVGIQETYNCGDDVAKENRTNDKILVNVMTLHGKMHFVIISQDRKFTQTFVDDFADHIQKSMKETIEYCSECREVEKTASDYQLYDLSNDQFEGLKKELAGEVLKIYELTPLQEGMLFHNLSETSSTAYVLQTIYNIDAELNSERVKQALRLLSIRYEVLRTAFIYENVIEPKQVIYQVREPEFHVEDYMNLAKDEKLRVFEQLIQADVARGFNLQKDPLLRVTFVEYDINKIRLVWSMHHIIVDGWCIQVLMRRFMEYYNLLDQDGSYDEIVKSVKEEQNQQGSYSEYIYWLRKQDQQNAKEYWRQLLGDYENECELRPMSSPSECKEQMRRSSVKVNKNITAQLKKYAKEQEITISTIVETICGLVLQTSTGNKDIVFGKVVSGRNAKIQGIEDMVGLFINTIPVRVRSEKDMLIKDLMIEQQKQSNESTNYDYISLAEIQNQTVQGKDLIKVLYVFENYTSGLQEDKNETDLDTLVSVEQIREQTNYGISIAAFETEEKLEYSVMYQPNRYVEEEISLFLNRLVKVSEEIAQSFDRKVEEIDSLTKKEQDIILGKFNGTQVDYPREKTVVDLFEEQVLLTPDKIAVVYDIQSITYHKLNEKVNSLAHILRDNGVEPDDLVAIIADRSIEMVQGIYGIMKAGGAYVPIDPTYPSERIQFILEDCKAKVVLKYTKEDIALPDGLTCIDLSVPDIFEGVVGNPVHKNQADDLVYCIYTSGTTGQPKGTLIEHQGVVNLKYMFVDMLGITSEDNVLQFANYVFDASVWEMTMALLNGATLVCMPQVIAQDPQEFSRYCKENHVTIATLPPNYYIQKDVEIQLRALITAGSESSMNIMKKLLK